MNNKIYDSFYYDGRKKKWKKENFKHGLPPVPSTETIEEWKKKWEETLGYSEQESALEKLFIKLLPLNNNLEDVLIKVCTLNDFYSTNIYKVLFVAKVIKDMNLDNVFKSNNAVPIAVDELNKKVFEDTNKHIYSFATKYFSHHRPDIYPIYDSYVDKLLRYYRDEYKFYTFKDKELSNYVGFYNVYVKFKQFFGLTNFTAKEIDKFLWQVAKHHFPKYKSDNEKQPSFLCTAHRLLSKKASNC